MTIKHSEQNQKSRAFTLIEMIGVLAVIAILAAVLIPKVFSAIDTSQVNNTAMSCNSVKTAIADHYGKYGGLACDGTQTPPAPLTVTTAAPFNNFDTYLLKEGLVDKLFAAKIGDGTSGTATGTRITLLQGPSALGGTITAASTPAAVTDASFDLMASGTNTINGSVVAVALITGVSLNQARALNAIIDGSAAAMGDGGTLSDTSGRVKYTFASATTNATVYVYLTHR